MAEEAKTAADPAFADVPADFSSKLVPDAADTLGGRTGFKEPSHPGLIRHLLTQLRPGQDLTRVTIPSFYLEDRSLLEKLTDIMMHPDIMLKVPKLKSPESRILQLTMWYLSGWHYKTVGVKKPYNPIIGETFACEWRHPDGSTSQYFAEQVSHRPPVSALYLENRKAGIVVNGQIWTKSRFQAPQTAVSILEGGATVQVLDHKETYRVKMPSYYAHGLLIGTLRTEIGDTGAIYCPQTGFRVDITFHQKPMFGGDYHVVTGTIKNVNTNTNVYTFKGKWNEAFTLTDCRTKKKSEWFDVRKLPVAPKYCLPDDQQGPWESRRLWSNVTRELHRRPEVEWPSVDAAKGALEDAQRQLPVHKGTGDWKTKKFHLKSMPDPMTGEAREVYVFDHISTTKLGKSEKANNLVWLSQTLRDVRTPDDTTGAAPAAAAAGAGAGAGAGTGAGAGAGSGAGAAAAADSADAAAASS